MSKTSPARTMRAVNRYDASLAGPPTADHRVPGAVTRASTVRGNRLMVVVVTGIMAAGTSTVARLRAV